MTGVYVFSNKMHAQSDVRHCSECLDHAEELMAIDDSIMSAYPYIKEASDIMHSYDGTSYLELFGNRCDMVMARYAKTRDSLYREYKANAEVCYHLNKPDAALMWIDKALQLNDSEDLKVMKSVMLSNK